MTKRDVAIKARLAKHYTRMTGLMAGGMDKDAASKRAFLEVTNKPTCLDCGSQKFTPHYECSPVAILPYDVVRMNYSAWGEL